MLIQMIHDEIQIHIPNDVTVWPGNKGKEGGGVWLAKNRKTDLSPLHKKARFSSMK